MKDYSVLEKIRKSADSCEIPESLNRRTWILRKKETCETFTAAGHGKRQLQRQLCWRWRYWRDF